MYRFPAFEKALSSVLRMLPPRPGRTGFTAWSWLADTWGPGCCPLTQHSGRLSVNVRLFADERDRRVINGPELKHAVRDLGE
jgi:hypothetical protein